MLNPKILTLDQTENLKCNLRLPRKPSHRPHFSLPKNLLALIKRWKTTHIYAQDPLLGARRGGAPLL